jgi:hypothetical protein
MISYALIVERDNGLAAYETLISRGLERLFLPVASIADRNSRRHSARMHQESSVSLVGLPIKSAHDIRLLLDAYKRRYER